MKRRREKKSGLMNGFFDGGVVLRQIGLHRWLSEYHTLQAAAIHGSRRFIWFL